MHIFHKWTHWGKPERPYQGYQNVYQRRECTKCGKVVERRV